jgi:hypothetical protein
MTLGLAIYTAETFKNIGWLAGFSFPFKVAYAQVLDIFRDNSLPSAENLVMAEERIQSTATIVSQNVTAGIIKAFKNSRTEKNLTPDAKQIDKNIICTIVNYSLDEERLFAGGLSKDEAKSQASLIEEDKPNQTKQLIYNAISSNFQMSYRERFMQYMHTLFSSKNNLDKQNPSKEPLLGTPDAHPNRILL